MLPNWQITRTPFKQFHTPHRNTVTTIAEIINYQSFIDQMNHHAPDPAAVSRPCFGVTSGEFGVSRYNAYVNAAYSDCIVDLDTNGFHYVKFSDSVIRYHGGPVDLVNVEFVNCRFDLDVPVSAPANPARDRLLKTLLESPNTNAITVSTQPGM